jgi:hypothetical protein
MDVTEIFNLLPGEKKIRIYKLGYLVVILSCSIFWYVYKRHLGIINYEELGGDDKRFIYTLVLFVIF